MEKTENLNKLYTQAINTLVAEVLRILDTRKNVYPELNIGIVTGKENNKYKVKLQNAEYVLPCCNDTVIDLYDKVWIMKPYGSSLKDMFILGRKE